MIKKTLAWIAGMALAASAMGSEPVGNTWTLQDMVTCNNGTIEAPFLGGCGTGWTLGSIPAAPSAATSLAFSDLISGPDTGLGDGLGSGAIVTVWGFGLGSSQGSSTIEYCDSTSTCRTGHVYYWKDADGTLPSGPANLYESHGMQEIAFSIPDSADGAGTIKVTVDGEESTLPFTVRAGNIYHVKSTGNDTTGDGSWANPWLTVAEADSTVNAGSTIYIGSLIEGSETTDKAIYNNRAEAMSTLANQFMYVAYPNSRVDVIGHRGVVGYNSDNDVTGIGFSKLSIFAAEADVGANDQPINARAQVSTGTDGFKDGRVVGNYFTDEHPSDANGACPDATGGAIQGGYLNGNKVENLKVLGNMIHEYGCAGSSKLHHTTYFTMRSQGEDVSVAAPEVAYNYLKDNKVKNGIHYYDEYNSGDICGDFNTTFKIHNNVIVNQAGSGIAYGATCYVDTPFEIYNNVIINAGLKADWDGISGPSNGSVPNGIAIRGSGVLATSVLDIHNNTIIGWNSDGETAVTDACLGLYGSGTGLTINWNDNICTQSLDRPYIQENYENPNYTLQGDNNVWFTSAGTQVNAVSPTWDAGKIITDPLLTVTGSQVSVGSGSPIIGQSTTTLPRDIYGNVRGATSELGAVAVTNPAIVFSENFDSTPDWYPVDGNESCNNVGACDGTVAQGWTYMRNTESWHPDAGEPTKEPSQRISSTNAFGGTGKAWTRYHESSGTNTSTFGDDSMLIKSLGDEYEELYASFDIKFDPNWQWVSGSNSKFKLFRFYHFDGPDGVANPWDFFSDGDNGPILIVDIKNSNGYGMRWTTSRRCDPQETVYYCGVGINDADVDTIMICPEGQTCNQGPGGTPSHAEVFGSDWHKVKMRIKLNTAIDATDGELQIWLDGVLQESITGIDWRQTGSSLSNGINMIAIGGNTTNWFDSPANKSEQWYALDNIVISTEDIP